MLFKKRRDEGGDILAMNKRSHDFCLSSYLLDLKNHFYFGYTIGVRHLWYLVAHS
jgi:hypothetical protein